MVFPNASTAVTEAVRHKNLPMVRWLIEQGADITIADKYGDRPYTVAVQNKDQELADYLKALEPEGWHNEQEKLRRSCPTSACQAGGILEDRPPAAGVPGAEMGEVGRALLFHGCAGDDLEAEEAALPDGGHGQLQRLPALLWSPRDKKLWYLDIEHEEFHPLAKWDDFIADPGRYLNGMIEGEFEE